MSFKVPQWIDPNWADGLSEFEYGFATGTWKETYWKKLVGHTKMITSEIHDEEQLQKNFYSKGQKIKPIRCMEWRPILINQLETQFVNNGKGAWRIFENPYNEVTKKTLIDFFEWHGHGCSCCSTEHWTNHQTSNNFKRKRIIDLERNKI